MSAARLLVVDDEALLRLAMVRTLERAGHVCDAAADGLEALDQLRRHAYALVLTDLRMPRMGGLELARQAAQLGLDQRFVLVSGHVEDLHDQVGQLGILRVVGKPIMPQTLRELVGELLASVERSG